MFVKIELRHHTSVVYELAAVFVGGTEYAYRTVAHTEPDKGITHQKIFMEAVSAGYRTCKVCKP